METLGTQTKRVLIREETYSIAIGFPINGSLAATDFAPNMMVKLNNDGTVSPIAASTDQFFGRVTSTYQNTDKGNVRIDLPISAHMHCKANGTLDEGQMLACTGFDATTQMPIYKAAASGDWISAICFRGGANNNTLNEIGVLRVPFLKA